MLVFIYLFLFVVDNEHVTRDVSAKLVGLVIVESQRRRGYEIAAVGKSPEMWWATCGESIT